MDRRAFLWMTLTALAGTGCVSRSQSGSLLPPVDADMTYSPGSPAEAKAIFKEFTGTAWNAAVPESGKENRWVSNTPGNTPENAESPPSVADESEKSARTAPQAEQPAGAREKAAPTTRKEHNGQRPPPASGPTAKRKKESESASLPATPRARVGDARRAVNGVITIHPGEVVQFEAQGYCLDPDRPAPSEGEPMRFIPMASLINFRLRRLFYKVLHMAGRQNTSYAADFQNVVWAIRTADAKQNSWGDELGGAEKLLLNVAMPGGAALLQQVRRLHLEQLFRQTPRGAIPHSDAQFSMLSSGVAGRAENLGRLRVRWQIANSSEKDFTFDAAQWALDTQRKVQREALPPPSSGLVVKA